MLINFPPLLLSGEELLLLGKQSDLGIATALLRGSSVPTLMRWRQEKEFIYLTF